MSAPPSEQIYIYNYNRYLNIFFYINFALRGRCGTIGISNINMIAILMLFSILQIIILKKLFDKHDILIKE